MAKLLHTTFQKHSDISGYPKEEQDVEMKVTALRKNQISLSLFIHYETFDIHYDEQPDVKEWKEYWKGDIKQHSNEECVIVINQIMIERKDSPKTESNSSSMYGLDNWMYVKEDVFFYELILKIPEKTFVIKRTKKPDYKPSEEMLEKERKKAGWDMSWHKSGMDPRDYPYPED